MCPCLKPDLAARLQLLLFQFLGLASSWFGLVKESCGRFGAASGTSSRLAITSTLTWFICRFQLLKYVADCLARSGCSKCMHCSLNLVPETCVHQTLSGRGGGQPISFAALACYGLIRQGIRRDSLPAWLSSYVLCRELVFEKGFESLRLDKLQRYTYFAASLAEAEDSLPRARRGALWRQLGSWAHRLRTPALLAALMMEV